MQITNNTWYSKDFIKTKICHELNFSWSVFILPLIFSWVSPSSVWFCVFVVSELVLPAADLLQPPSVTLENQFLSGSSDCLWLGLRCLLQVREQLDITTSFVYLCQSELVPAGQTWKTLKLRVYLGMALSPQMPSARFQQNLISNNRLAISAIPSVAVVPGKHRRHPRLTPSPPSGNWL